MEPITLAAITSGIVSVGLEVAKGTASAAGASLWGKVKGLLAWEEVPKTEDLAIEVARKLDHDDGLASQIVKLLKQSEETQYSNLVGKIDAEKVVVINSSHIETFNM